MYRYLLYNPCGPAADDLLADLPEDVTAVACGHTAESEATWTALLSSLGLAGVSAFPCLLTWEDEHDVEDAEFGTVTIPGRWIEIRIADMSLRDRTWTQLDRKDR